MIRLLCALAAALAWLPFQASAQPTGGEAPGQPIFKFAKRKPDPQPIPESLAKQLTVFFQALMKGPEAVRPAFDTLLKGSRLAERTESVAGLAGRTEEALKVFGNAIDFEHYDTQKAGKRLLNATYLSWHALQPVQWRFVFYAPGADWTLINVQVSDSIEDLFE